MTTMPRVELAWDADCPHVDAARANLTEALRSIDAEPHWIEWRRDDSAAPDYAVRAGSPAILVDGRDVEGHDAGTSACCRVYRDAQGRRAAAPSVDVIVRAVRAAMADSGA